jgi:trimethylamine--corrinoid protein Co-methyltransferase
MKTTVGSYGAYEFHLLVAAGAELSAHIGIPFYGTAGCSDAKFLDEQAVAELTMEVMSTTLSKANLIHDIGVLDHCNSVAPEAVVLCDDLIEGLKVFARGVGEVNEKTLAIDLMEKIGPAGTYVTDPHTAKNYKSVFYSKLFSRKMKNPEHSEVREKIRSIIDKALAHPVPELDSAVLADLAKWEKKLLG